MKHYLDKVIFEGYPISKGGGNMKRIAARLLLLCLMWTFVSGCAEEAQMQPEVQMPLEGYGYVNLNNVLPIRPDFYFFDQGYFYEQDGFYNMGVYRSLGGESEMLFQESDLKGMLCTYYVHGWDLYFVMMQDEGHFLWRYDLKTDTYEQICSIGNPEYMGVLGDDLVYLDRTDRKNAKVMLLNPETGAEQMLFEKAEAFGLVAGQVRCIVLGDSYEIHCWDPDTGESKKLGAFALDVEVPYAFYGFTANHVVMYTNPLGDGRTFLSYSLADGAVTEYTLPKDIHELVAGDDAVFLLAYDSEKNASVAVPSPENGVYRVDLSEGACKQVITDIDDQTKMYVLSDDSLVLIQSKLRFFFRYGQTAYRYDLLDGTCEKIGTLN